MSSQINSGNGVMDVYNPWNPNNKPLPEKDIYRVLRRYGIFDTILDIRLFQIACIHKSYRKKSREETEASGQVWMEPIPKPPEVMDLQEEDSERLEFIGDAILGCSVALYLYKRYPDESEGFYTRLRTKLVNNKTLGILVQRMGLHKWLVMSRHQEERCNGRRNLKILGSLLESWIGAVCKEYDQRGMCGFEYAQNFVIRILEEHIDFAMLISEDFNYKDGLLRIFQSMFHETPRYRELEVKGPLHDREFTMGVIDPRNDSIIATGKAKVKKIAEQIASKKAIEILQGLQGLDTEIHSGSGSGDMEDEL
jgi:ribonuclease III